MLSDSNHDRIDHRIIVWFHDGERLTINNAGRLNDVLVTFEEDYQSTQQESSVHKFSNL